MKTRCATDGKQRTADVAVVVAVVAPAVPVRVVVVLAVDEPQKPDSRRAVDTVACVGDLVSSVHVVMPCVGSPVGAAGSCVFAVVETVAV